jgi:serine phosphatase RsbU (regulator of sigma subunit)
MNPENGNIPEVKISYWDRNYKKFKTYSLVFCLLLLGVIFYHFYKNSRTIFTGTTYTLPPSRFYVSKELVADRIDKTQSGVRIIKNDTIHSGGYLISVDGKFTDSYPKLLEILKEVSSDSEVSLTVFYLGRSLSNKNDFENRNSLKGMVNTYKILKKNLPEYSLRDLGDAILINSTNLDGATYRAGVLPGDILLSINGTPLKMVRTDKGDHIFTIEAMRFLRSHAPGEIVPFQILRDNKEITINVQLATFGIQVNQLVLTILGLICFMLGFFYVIKRPEIFAARITGFAFIFLGFNIASSYNINSPDFDTFTFLIVFFCELFGVYFIALFFHSLAYFPVEYKSVILDKKKIAIPYIISTILTLVLGTWYFIDFQSIDVKLLSTVGLLNPLYFIYIRFSARKDLNKEQKKIVRPVNFVFYLFLLVAFLRVFMSYIPLEKESKLLDYSGLIIVLIPAIYLYITWKYRLLNIDFHIRRNIQYNFVTFIWKAALIFIFVISLLKLSRADIEFPNIKVSGTSIEFLTHELSEDLNLIYEKIFIIIIAIALFILLVKINRIGQNYIDKKFYREKFDYKFAQFKLIRLLESKLTIESLSEILIEKISELVHLKVTGIALIKDDKIWDEKLYYYDRIKHSKHTFLLNSEMLKILMNMKGSVAVEYLPFEIRSYLKKYNFAIVTAIRTNEKVQGLLFIGNKLSETPLRYEDIDFLDSIISNISISLENTFLYEELANQERIKHELNLARNIQLASLPQEVPCIAGLDIFADSIPAFEVGGDFYDFLNGSADDLTVIIGDVSGKGTSSALYMLKIQGILQTLHEFNLSPKELLMRANRLLYKHIVSKSYITAISANFKIREKVLRIARAGHLPMYYYNNSENKIIQIRPNGLGLGLSEENTFNAAINEENMKFNTGDIFLFISDGITDSRNHVNEQFGESRLEDLLMSNKNASSKEICDIIIKKALEFSGKENQFDDMTIVAVKIDS